MNIAFFEVAGWERKLAEEKLKGHTLLFFPGPLTARSAAKAQDAEVVVVFIYSDLSAATLAKLPKLRFIATMSTGYDHINIEECKKQGIKVANVPTYGENTVAEHTFALILALSRRLVESVNASRDGKFSPDGFTGFDLKGKTLGVVGTGHIGQHVIRIANGFQMNVLAYDVVKDATLARSLGFRYVSLDTLLRKAAIVTLHVPYGSKTHHFMNRERIGKMMKGSYLINTARGGLVDTDALLRALSSKHLAGAGIDVLEEERAIKEEKQIFSKNYTHNILTVLQNHILMEKENVIVTPHNAFNSTEALERILQTTLENIQGHAKKRYVHRVA